MWPFNKVVRSRVPHDYWGTEHPGTSTEEDLFTSDIHEYDRRSRAEQDLGKLIFAIENGIKKNGYNAAGDRITYPQVSQITLGALRVARRVLHDNLIPRRNGST